jgi:hypothetical protein
VAEHQQAVSLLEKQGMPAGAIMPVFDSLESILYGNIMYTTAVAADDRTSEWKEHYPGMYRADRAAALDSEAAFRQAAGSVIDGIVSAVLVMGRAKPAPHRRTRKSRAHV